MMQANNTARTIWSGKRKGWRWVAIFLGLLLLAAGVTVYALSQSPAVQFQRGLQQLTEDKGDYNLMQGLVSLFTIHQGSMEQGEVRTTAEFTISTDGTQMDAMLASTINQWGISCIQQKSGGRVVTELFGESRGKKDPFFSTYRDEHRVDFRLADSQESLSLRLMGWMEGEHQEDRDYFVKQTVKILQGKGKVKSFSSERGRFSILPEEGEVKCRKVSFRLTSAEMKVMLTEFYDTILRDERMLSYFSTQTFDNLEECKARLQEWKSQAQSLAAQELEAAVYQKGGQTLGFSFSYQSQQRSYTVGFTQRKEGEGYRRQLLLSDSHHSLSLTSQTSGSTQASGQDEGVLRWEDLKKGSSQQYFYTLSHSGPQERQGGMEDTIVLRSEEAEERTLSIQNSVTQTGYEGYDLSTAVSNIMYTGGGLTFAVEINSTLDSSKKPEITPWPEGIEIVDGSGRINRDLFSQKCSEWLDQFWNSKVFVDFSSTVEIKKQPIIDRVTSLLNKISSTPVEIRNPDIQEETTEETTEFVYVPPEEETQEEEIRTWEEIVDDPKYTPELWDRFWGYYLSDDGMKSERHSNIVDYFYDFLERYY